MQRAELEESQLDSDGEDEDEEEAYAPQSSQPTREGTSRMQEPSTQQPPQSSIIEDLGDPSDEDDDE